MPLLPSIHKQAKKSQKGSPGKSSGPRSPVKQKSEPDMRELESVAYKDNRLLAQVLQLKGPEEEQVAAMIKKYTQFLKSQIMSDSSYARALEKEHMERSSLVFKLQKQLEEVRSAFQVCSGPPPRIIANGKGEELLDKYEHDIQRLEDEMAAVKAQAASGRHQAASALREERAINDTLTSEVLASQVLAKQKAKLLKAAQAELRRTQVAIARKHPQLGIFDAIALEEALAVERGEDIGIGPEDEATLDCEPSYLQRYSLTPEISQATSSMGSRGQTLEPRHGSPAKHRQLGSPHKPLPPVVPRHGSPSRRPHHNNDSSRHNNSNLVAESSVGGGHQHFQIGAETSAARPAAHSQLSEAATDGNGAHAQDAKVVLCLVVQPDS